MHACEPVLSQQGISGSTMPRGYTITEMWIPLGLTFALTYVYRWQKTCHFQRRSALRAMFASFMTIWFLLYVAVTKTDSQSVTIIFLYAFVRLKKTA